MKYKVGKNTGKKIFYIGIPAVVGLGIVWVAGLYLRSDGFEGISAAIVLEIAGSIVFALLTSISFAAWVFEDCKKRGEDAVLWVILIFITGTFVGLLLYLLRRSEVKRDCPSCGHRISLRAKYCEECGNLVENREEVMLMEKRTHHLKYLICGTVCAVLMLTCLVGFCVSLASGEGVNNSVSADKNLWNSGVITMSVETKLGNTWKVRFNSASNGFVKEAKMKIDDISEEKLYADISCGEVPEGAELILWLVQGEKAESINVTNLSEPLEYPLNEFQQGKIRIRLQINGVKEVKSQIQIK